MNKLNKVLMMSIAMLAIMIAAVGIDKGIEYYKGLKWEKERVEVYEQARMEIETAQAKIETLSEDPAALIAYIEENELNYVEKKGGSSQAEWEAPTRGEMPQQFEEESEAAEGTEADESMAVSEETISDNEAEEVFQEEVPDEVVQDEEETVGMGNAATVSDNEAFGDGGMTVSENEAQEETVSENEAESGTVSDNESVGGDNTVSDNESGRESVSDNEAGTVSDNESEDDSVSDNESEDDSISDNGTVTPEIAGKEICASYEETIRTNAYDKEVIASMQADFSDVKITCIGDSITEAANLKNKEDYGQSNYPYYLGEILGAEEVVNLGIGGSSIGRYWENAFVDRYREIPEDTDLILVMGGTNDGFCATEIEMGSLDERKEGTFIGDLDELLTCLEEDYPDAMVVLVTPPANVLHDILKKSNPTLLPQSAFIGIMLQLAAEHEIPVIDFYHDNMLDTHDAAVIQNFMPDGVHGNAQGYRVIAEHIAAKLIALYTGMEE